MCTLSDVEELRRGAPIAPVRGTSWERDGLSTKQDRLLSCKDAVLDINFVAVVGPIGIVITAFLPSFYVFLPVFTFLCVVDLSFPSFSLCRYLRLVWRKTDGRA